MIPSPKKKFLPVNEAYKKYIMPATIAISPIIARILADFLCFMAVSFLYRVMVSYYYYSFTYANVYVEHGVLRHGECT